MKKENNNITELVFILDKSGSMHGLEADTVGGFNSMIEEQQKEKGECFVSTYLFSNTSTLLHDRCNIKNIEKMKPEDFITGGCTALYDTVGTAIEHISMVHKYIRSEDIPNNVIFVITTDGMENASCSFNAARVKKMINCKKEMGWEFLFLGANIDAVEAAAEIGIDETRAANYTAAPKATINNYSVLNETICCARACGVINDSWKKKVK